MADTLILYYSCQSHTHRVAQLLQKLVGGDLYRIQLQEEYSPLAAYTKGLYHVKRGLCPAFKEAVNLEGYSTIYLGSPVWYWTLTPPITKVLQEQDWRGKTLIPFLTNGKSNGDCFAKIARLAVGATVKEGGSISMVKDKADSVLLYELKNWLARLQ